VSPSVPRSPFPATVALALTAALLAGCSAAGIQATPSASTVNQARAHDVPLIDPAVQSLLDGPDAGKAPKHSAREAEVVRLVTAGRSNREIADHLAISSKTVEKHLSSAYQKLGISSRLDLLRATRV